MSTLFDESRICVQSPGERTDADVPTGGAPAQVRGPLVARGDGLQESEPDTNSLGRRLLEAMKQFMATWVAPEVPVVVAPAPPTEALAASPFDLEALLAGVNQAATKEEAMAAVTAFADGLEPTLMAAENPLAALAAIFGSESGAAVTAVFAAAVVDLEAETAATGGPLTDPSCDPRRSPHGRSGDPARRPHDGSRGASTRCTARPYPARAARQACASSRRSPLRGRFGGRRSTTRRATRPISRARRRAQLARARVDRPRPHTAPRRCAGRFTRARRERPATRCSPVPGGTLRSSSAIRGSCRPPACSRRPHAQVAESRGVVHGSRWGVARHP